MEVDTGREDPPSEGDESDDLSQLGADVYDQCELEENVMRELQEELDRDDQKRARRRMKRDILDLNRKIRQKRIVLSGMKEPSADRKRVVTELRSFELQERGLRRKLQSGQAINEIDSDEDDPSNSSGAGALGHQPPVHQEGVSSFGQALRSVEGLNSSGAVISTKSSKAARKSREELVRLGQMTPFGTSLSTLDSPASLSISVRTSGETSAATTGVPGQLSPRYTADDDDGHSTPVDVENANFSSASTLRMSPSLSRVHLKGKDVSSSSVASNVSSPFALAASSQRYASASLALPSSNSRSAFNIPRRSSAHSHHSSRSGDDDEEDRRTDSEQDNSGVEEYVPSRKEMRDSFRDCESDCFSGAEEEKAPRTKKRKTLQKQKGSSRPLSQKKGSLYQRPLSPERKSKICPGKKKTACLDDGDCEMYKLRLDLVATEQERRQKVLCRKEDAVENGLDDSLDDLDETSGLPTWLKAPLCLETGVGTCPPEDHQLSDGLTVPGNIWNKLYLYQRVGVQWLWELHIQNVGGIVGDEMGLGKTIQTIALFAALHHSRIPITVNSRKHSRLGPVLIVCPATLLHQWVAEFHYWYPILRVAVLHDTGTHKGQKTSPIVERCIFLQKESKHALLQLDLVADILSGPGVLLTTYTGVRLHADLLLPGAWSYVVLDEGHKIRNPDAAVTVTCKQFKTCHRIILSGSPMQNNLRELWSVFDFVFPGRLGTLPVFTTELAVPITQGGYCTATTQQVQTAYKCACVLRDTINPYLLRRMKVDVQSNVGLPPKNEQVLFCRLSTEQRKAYKKYLKSREVESILTGTMKVFAGLITLTKICNHPDLTTEDDWSADLTDGLRSIRSSGSLASAGPTSKTSHGCLPTSTKARNKTASTGFGNPASCGRTPIGIRGPDSSVVEPISEASYGYWKRSGKLLVVHSLLKMWYRQSHRALIFSQTKQALDILERYVASRGYKYLRMDGDTNITRRQPMVNQYNSDNSIFVFLLTTRVGGLGINLTGADRVVIFDPDWNPSTDMQARERAWRIGQERNVTVYRLLTTGTIEEKIYHRQIFKQFLTNRVLSNPKQRRFFKANDLHELFSLRDDIGFKRTTKSEAKAAGGTGSSQNDGKLPLTETAAIFAGMGADVAIPKKRKRAREDVAPDNLSLDPADDQDSPKTKRRKKSRPHTAIDGHRIRNLDSVELRAEKGSDSTAVPSETPVCSDTHSPLQASSSTKKGKEVDDGSGKHQEDDDYILRNLFKKSGLLGALQHDSIMDSTDSDYALVEAEADRVAKQAALHLARSRAAARDPFQPTWTGSESRAAGIGLVPQKKRAKFGKQNAGLKSKQESVASKGDGEGSNDASKFGGGKMAGANIVVGARSTTLHSSSLLAKMRARKNNAASAVCDEAPAASGEKEGGTPPLTSDVLIEKLHQFLASCTDRTATSQELLTEFSPHLTATNARDVFRSMLRRLCDFSRTISKEGVWKLKENYN